MFLNISHFKSFQIKLLNSLLNINELLITLHMKINKKCKIKYHHLFKKKIRIERGIYLMNFQIFLKTNFYMKKLILYFAHFHI